MKFSIHQQLRRRDLLRSIGAAAFALPALELFGRDALAQATTGKSKFIVFCYTPDGVNQNQFWPSGTTTNFTLSSTLQPFTPYKDKMLLLGPQMSGSSLVSNTGLKYISQVMQHEAPVTLAARS